MEIEMTVILLLSSPVGSGSIRFLLKPVCNAGEPSVPDKTPWLDFWWVPASLSDPPPLTPHLDPCSDDDSLVSSCCHFQILSGLVAWLLGPRWQFQLWMDASAQGPAADTQGPRVWERHGERTEWKMSDGGLQTHVRPLTCVFGLLWTDRKTDKQIRR